MKAVGKLVYWNRQAGLVALIDSPSTTMRLSSFALRLSLVCLVVSCQRDEPSTPIVTTNIYSVPADVEPYIQHFRDEVQKRGRAISVDNLVVTFGKTAGEDVCGQCLLEAGQPPRIVLSTTDYCWQKASENERECLVFHELGHCLIKRMHRTDRFPNGAFVSLMNRDDVSVYATCQYPIGMDECDKRPRRGYYIDELVDPTTPAPPWGK